MKSKKLRSLLVRSVFIAANFLFFYSIAVGSLRASSSPLPDVKDDLLIERSENVFSYEYRRGHTMAIANTELLGSPYVADEPMAYLDACKNKTPISSGELRIYQSSYAAADQSGSNLKLNCDLMPVSEVWLTTFLEVLPICLEKSAQEVGWGMPESVIVHSVMIYMHKGSSNKLSLHAPARAVDISKFELVYPEGKRDVVVSLASQANNPVDDTTIERKFYRAFRGCWSDVLVKDHGCSNWSQQNYRGSVGWEDSAHQNHLHLSRPFCPNDSNFKGG